MATPSNAFPNKYFINFANTPVISSEKLNGSGNYMSWFASVELWFVGQGYEDHLVKRVTNIPEKEQSQWKQVVLCNVLWQSINRTLAS